MSNPPIPITTFGGYLGAGKTTLLNRVLQSPGGRRLGVIVNDFGALQIDADLLVDGGADDLVSLPNGCVCCSLGDDLFAALDTMQSLDHPPDQIIVEASGVADPATVAAWGTSAGFEPGGIVVVAAADGVRRHASDAYVGGEVVRQISGADLVVVSKVDLCSAAELTSVRSWLRDRTRAPLVDMGLDEPLPIDVLLGLRPESTPDPTAPHDASARYESWSVQIDDPVNRAALERVLETLPVGLLRLKGIVVDEQQRTLVVNVVGPSIHIAVSAISAVASSIVAIGVRGVVDFSSLEREMGRLAGHPDWDETPR